MLNKIQFQTKQIKKFIFTIIIIACNSMVNAQDANEIQVYASATTPKYMTIIELHSNYTFKGPKSNEKYHPLLETIEITTGVTKDFELGFYIFTYNNNGKLQYTGSNIRPRIKAPVEWNWPIGVSLSSEIGFSLDPISSQSDWGAEIRPIFDKTLGSHYLSFNPNLGLSFTNKEYLFEPNFKYAFAAVPKASFGFEYYGNTGKIFNPYKLPLQEHIMYLVLDLFIHPLFEFNLGIGEGLTESSNGLNVKCFIGKRINWKHK